MPSGGRHPYPLSVGMTHVSETNMLEIELAVIYRYYTPWG